MFLVPAIWIGGFADFKYISVLLKVLSTSWVLVSTLYANGVSSPPSGTHNGNLKVWQVDVGYIPIGGGYLCTRVGARDAYASKKQFSMESLITMNILPMVPPSSAVYSLPPCIAVNIYKMLKVIRMCCTCQWMCDSNWISQKGPLQFIGSEGHYFTSGFSTPQVHDYEF